MKLASIEALVRALDQADVPFIVDMFVTEPFDFDAEHRQALEEEIAPGIRAHVLRLETLLRLEEQAGRPQDLADIAQLRLLHGGHTDG